MALGARRKFEAADGATTDQASQSSSHTSDDSAYQKGRSSSSIGGAKLGMSTSVNYEDLELDTGLLNFARNHRWDPNLPIDYADQVNAALESHDVEAEIALERSLAEQSPYPEVQSAVRNYDEDLPASTVRAWVIGLVLTTIGSSLNMLFSMRQPSIYITSIVAQLIAFPLGKGWDKIMPDMEFVTFGVRWKLKPGPFNMKEHTLIVVMANASFGNGAAYATDVILAQRAFYHQHFGWGYELLLIWTSQMIGYGLAGLARRFLVWPAAMIWPTNLVNTSLFYALHDHAPTDPQRTGGWSIGRYKYFAIVAAGSFFWYWLPGFLFQALSVFAFLTWIFPQNVIVNQLFGGFTGLSLLPLTFDWSVITGYIQSPLIPPWHAIVNTIVGLVSFIMITAVGVHYSGAWYSKWLPFSDSNSYDNTGRPYNVSKILTPDFTLDVDKYEEYSPLFLSTTFALAYGMSFATMVSLIVHTVIYNGKEIWLRFKLAREQEDDVHMRLMKKYPDAPDWWYMALFAITVGLSFVLCYAYPTYLTGWAFVIAVLIPIIWSIPIGMVQGITNIQIGLNVLTEFIVGYMQPGRPTAMMMFKTYGYITMYQGLAFVQDLKLGHYMKVPPRAMFWSQTVATFWSSVVQIAVLNWALGAIPDICSPTQSSHFTCPNGRVFFNASVIWGLIGPARIFSPGQIYSALFWFFLIGAVLPVVLYVLACWRPRSFWRYMMAPVIFGGTGQVPPATPLNYLSWGCVGWIFQRYLRNKHMGWWMQYNYITSAGLDVGLALCIILIFLTITLTNTSAPSWWGNNVVSSTLDYQGRAVRNVVPPGETFGPAHW